MNVFSSIFFTLLLTTINPAHASLTLPFAKCSIDARLLRHDGALVAGYGVGHAAIRCTHSWFEEIIEMPFLAEEVFQIPIDHAIELGMIDKYEGLVSSNQGNVRIKNIETRLYFVSRLKTIEEIKDETLKILTDVSVDPLDFVSVPESRLRLLSRNRPVIPFIPNN